MFEFSRGGIRHVIDESPVTDGEKLASIPQLLNTNHGHDWDCPERRVKIVIHNALSDQLEIRCVECQGVLSFVTADVIRALGSGEALWRWCEKVAIPPNAVLAAYRKRNLMTTYPENSAPAMKAVAEHLTDSPEHTITVTLRAQLTAVCDESTCGWTYPADHRSNRQETVSA